MDIILITLLLIFGTPNKTEKDQRGKEGTTLDHGVIA
jgi:hypothetical protein